MHGMMCMVSLFCKATNGSNKAALWGGFCNSFSLSLLTNVKFRSILQCPARCWKINGGFPLIIVGGKDAMFSFFKSYAHHLLGITILVAHASEIGHVATHLSWYHAVVALLVFGAWYTTRTNHDACEELN